MSRVPLITDKAGLDPEQVEVFDWIVRSRGSMLRPFEVLLHRPGVARLAAELGAKVRFESTMSDHDRELVIIATAKQHRCAFEWDSHLPLARKAGVREEVIGYLEEGGAADLTETEAVLAGFVRELCTTSTVSEDTFRAAQDHLGQTGVIELAATVGYYTLLGYVMGACGAC